MLRWYAVKTHIGRELIAVQELNNQYPDRAFAPLMYADKKNPKNKDRLTQVMWPGYCFLQLDDDLQTGDDFSPIRSTRGVNGGLVSFGGQYRPIAPGIVESLQGYTHGEAIDYEKGEQIRILSGPFEGFIGRLEKANDEVVTAWVTLLGNHREVEFLRQNVSPV